MAFKLIESAQQRWRAVNSAHLVALVRAGAKCEGAVLVERPGESTGGDTHAARHADPQASTIPLGACGDSPDRHRSLCGGAAGSCTVTQSPPAGRGVRVRVPSCAWVMLLTIARPRPTPAGYPLAGVVRMRLVPR
jgi:hypothetical protein